MSALAGKHMAMGIEDVLRLCAEGGLRISATGGQLRVQHGPTQPDSALLALLREHKAALLALLEARDAQPGEAIARRQPSERARVLASPAQRRMVLLDQLDPQAARYNMVGAFMLRGRLERDALRAAMEDVIERHETLRSRFDSVDGQVWQIVDPMRPLAWECIDLSGQPVQQQEAVLQERLRMENNWRFDLGAGTLLRLTVLLMGDRLAALIVNVHHIVCDGQSVAIIKREWAQCYAVRCAGSGAPVPGPLVQYGDYCHWLHQQGQERRWRAQLEYWASQLEGAPHLHSLPLDHPRTPKQGHAGSKQYRTLAAGALARLRRQCQAHDVTLFMYLQTAFAAVLALYANETDIVMGTPVAGRRHRDLEGTVGLFVNTLVLRSRVDGNLSFAQLLAANKAMIVQALEHQDVPFDEVVEQLGIPRSRAVSPLVQILFVLQTELGGELRLPGGEVEYVANDSEPVKVELQLVAHELNGQLQLEWHFNTGLFAEASIARMADSLLRLVAVLDAQSDTPLFALPLADHDTTQAPHCAETLDAPLGRLERWFEQAADRFPERVAVAGDDASLSYRELDQQASALAARLCAWGVQRAALVALHLDRSPAMLVAMLGVLKAGAAYLPLDPAHPPARLQAILDDSGAQVLLTQRAMAQVLDLAKGRKVLLDDEAALTSGAAPLPDRATHLAQDPAYILYTSGTSGQPKGVIVAHAGVANLLNHMDALAPLGEAPHGMLWSNFCFDLSVYEMYSMFCRGGTLHIVPDALRLEPQLLFKWMDARRITSAFMHAAYLAQFGDHVGGGGGQALRRMMVGVEPIAAGPVEAIARQVPGLRVLNAYGPTESSICSTLFLLGRMPLAADALLPIGRAVHGLELRVMNAMAELVPPGAIGELYVGGVGLALGYLNRPDLNQAKFVTLGQGAARTRFYRTGDFVRLNACGELDFLGRMDTQVKLRGFRIELSEIETRLCQLDEVSAAVVVAAGDAVHRQLNAYVVLKDAARATNSPDFELRARQALRKLLPEYMVPSSIIVLERIPLNANGKLQTERLPAPAVNAGGKPAIAARDTVEARLLQLWADVLEVEGLGVTDDFFAAGGQSLLAMRLVARIRSEFSLGEGVISIVDLLDNPTAEMFARAHALVLAEESARRKIHYLASMQDAAEEGVF
jgi:amino acid adenylation domain-containing protein